MGFFVSKKEIDSQLQQLDHSQQQAIKYFKQKYSISPKESTQEVKRLEHKAKNNQLAYEQLQAKLSPISKEQDMFQLEYQKQNLLLGLRHDKQKVLNHLSQLEQKNRPLKQSAQHVIIMEENQRLLDSISKQNFQTILKDLEPEKQKALIELQERGEIRKRTITRTR